MRISRVTSIHVLLWVTLIFATAPGLSAQSAAQPPAQHRATSKPYSGHLSIFETPER